MSPGDSSQRLPSASDIHNPVNGSLRCRRSQRLQRGREILQQASEGPREVESVITNSPEHLQQCSPSAENDRSFGEVYQPIKQHRLSGGPYVRFSGSPEPATPSTDFNESSLLDGSSLLDVSLDAHQFSTPSDHISPSALCHVLHVQGSMDSFDAEEGGCCDPDGFGSPVEFAQALGQTSDLASRASSLAFLDWGRELADSAVLDWGVSSELRMDDLCSSHHDIKDCSAGHLLQPPRDYRGSGFASSLPSIPCSVDVDVDLDSAFCARSL